MATPLKIRDGSGNIQELTTSEENYVAYQIGLHLSADSANGIGSITTNTSHTSTGTYTNTFFNEPVGTHPSTSITTGSTVTTLYQNRGTAAAETDSDIKTPLMWVDSGSQTGFKQMPDADLNEAVDRYLSKIFTNDYPGVFKLGSTSPGPNYSVWLSSVFTDTRTDGTSVAYNIYRRDTYSAPTETPPMYVRDNGGFDGIQAMTDRQIKYSFGQRAKSRIGASKIGTYQIRSSAQGAPTDPGTWISAGSATDTKQTTSDQTFTTTYVGTYNINYTRTYTGNYQNTYTSNYVRLYTGTYTSNYATNYTRQFQNTVLQNYSADYARFFETKFIQGNYTGRYAKIYTVEFNLLYTSTFAGFFAASYIRNFDKNYTGDFGPLPYARSFTSFYTRIDTATTVTYAKNYTRLLNYNRVVSPTYIRSYIGTRQFISPYALDIYTSSIQAGTRLPLLYEGHYEAVLAPGGINVTASYMRVYLNPDDISTGRGANSVDPLGGVYLGGVDGIPYDNINAYITANAADHNVSTSLPGGGARFYDGPQVGYLRTGTAYFNGSANSGNYYYERVPAGAIITYVAQYQNSGYLGPLYYTGERGFNTNYVRDISSNYGRFASYATNYTRNIPYTRIDTLTYQGDYDARYTSVYVRNFNQTYLSVVQKNYDRRYTNRNYIPYLRVYTSALYEQNYSGSYENIYVTAYQAAYVSIYTGQFARDYTNSFESIDYNATYTRLFNTTYTSTTDVQYESIFETNYVGSFQGLTIDATDETVETYTLYVRIS